MPVDILLVADPGDTHCFVYSKFNRQGTEFLCLDVPVGKAKAVAALMNFLSSRECERGQTVHRSGMHFILNSVEGERRRDLLHTHMTATDQRCKNILELLPRFEPDPDHVDSWGSYPPAPEGRSDLVGEITQVWMYQGSFVLHKDGNPSNDKLDNLKFVDLATALKHPDRYNVDWDADLTHEQKSFVLKHLSYFRKIARSLWRSVKKCGHCGVLGDTGKNVNGKSQLLLCSACKEVHYCCKEHQLLDWKEHKPQCLKMQDMRRMK